MKLLVDRRFNKNRGYDRDFENDRNFFDTLNSLVGVAFKEDEYSDLYAKFNNGFYVENGLPKMFRLNTFTGKVLVNGVVKTFVDTPVLYVEVYDDRIYNIHGKSKYPVLRNHVLNRNSTNRSLTYRYEDLIGFRLYTLDSENDIYRFIYKLGYSREDISNLIYQMKKYSYKSFIDSHYSEKSLNLRERLYKGFNPAFFEYYAA